MGQLLIVDEDKTYACSLAEEARRHGHDALVATSGPDAVELLLAGKLKPDLVVVNAAGNDGEGLAVVRAVRSLGLASPVTALLGSLDVDLLGEALLSGATDAVVKREGDEAVGAVLASLERATLRNRGVPAAMVDGIGRCKHELANALLVVDGRLRRLVSQGAAEGRGADFEAIRGGVDRMFRVLKELDRLRGRKAS
jgi:DNA-binding response OmpR family regulator